jgi:hypothetical protein
MVTGVTTGVSAGGRLGVVSMTALRYAQSDGGEVVMPVRPAQLIYANFKHIQVVPESRLQDGVPLYKLKILDTLIDQLSPKRAIPAITAGSIDGIIGEMSGGTPRGGVTGTPASRGTAAAYRAGFLPPPGAFVNLVA